MAEAGERVFVGVGRPTFLERHTPRAHSEAIMQRYFWVGDHLEGKPKEIFDNLKPLAEKSAKVAGWTQTITEVYMAGQAVALAAFLAGRKILSFRKAKSINPQGENGFKPTDNQLRNELRLAREILRKRGGEAVMLSDGRILSKEGKAVVIAHSHPGLSSGEVDSQAYYAALPIEERHAVETEAAELRALRKKGKAKGSTDLGKIKIELMKVYQSEQRPMLQKAFQWFREEYSARTSDWNTSVLNRFRQSRLDPPQKSRLSSNGRVSLWNRMIPDAAYAFATRFWQLVQEAGGREVYQEKIDAIRRDATASTLDGYDSLEKALGDELGRMFVHRKTERTAFVYELMKMELTSKH